MLTPETIDAAARTCFEMHEARTRYQPLDAALRAASLEDAYRIQDALHRLMAGARRDRWVEDRADVEGDAADDRCRSARGGRAVLVGNTDLARPHRRRRVSPRRRRVRGGGAPRRRSAGEWRPVDARVGGRPRR